MLQILHIENIAVIEQADIMFDRGLNVLTGETGAGKSIVIDAISAILGERTYRDLIRTGCEKASVSAVFRDIPQIPWFEEKQISYDKEELLIQREIYADGKNACRVNGRPVTVSILRELGRNLINIHGQHDTQTLFDESTHLQYLDLVNDSTDAKDSNLDAYEKYRDILAQVRRLSMDEGERLRKVEMLRYQTEEIDRAQLQAGEDEELKNRQHILRNAERLSDGLRAAVAALFGGDDYDGAVSLLDSAQRELSRLGNVDGKYDAFAGAVSELRYSAQDIAEDIRSELEELSYSGDELERIESRLDVIYRLCKKYGNTTEDVLAYAERCREELDEIEFSDSKLEILKDSLEKAQKVTSARGQELRKERKKTSKFLAERIESELAQLDMPNIRFQTEFEECEISETGMDTVRFLMSANVGEALKPLSKVASGGELARIMLAMKNVLSEKDRIPTMIFDEVDAGVSGRAAQKVAEKLLSVAKGKQVFCVTHLPQIAAIADCHLLIAKTVRDKRTYTSVTPLDKQGRVEELARIIGGSDITENTRKSAEDMLRI